MGSSATESITAVLLFASLLSCSIATSEYGEAVNDDKAAISPDVILTEFTECDIVIESESLTELDRLRALSKMFINIRKHLLDYLCDSHQHLNLNPILPFCEFYTAPYDTQIDNLSDHLHESWRNPFLPIPNHLINGSELITLRARFNESFYDHINNINPDDRLSMLQMVFIEFQLTDDLIAIVLQRCRQSIGRDLCRLSEQGSSYDDILSFYSLSPGKYDHILISALLSSDETLSASNANRLALQGTVSAADIQARLCSYLHSRSRVRQKIDWMHLSEALKAAYPECGIKSDGSVDKWTIDLSPMQMRWINRKGLIPYMTREDQDLVLKVILLSGLQPSLRDATTNGVLNMTRILFQTKFRDLIGYDDMLALACPMLCALIRTMWQFDDDSWWYPMYRLLGHLIQNFRTNPWFMSVVEAILERAASPLVGLSVIEARLELFNQVVLVSKQSPYYERESLRRTGSQFYKPAESSCLWMLSTGLDRSQVWSLIWKIWEQVQYFQRRGYETDSVLLVKKALAEYASHHDLIDELHTSLVAQRSEQLGRQPRYDFESSLFLSFIENATESGSFVERYSKFLVTEFCDPWTPANKNALGKMVASIPLSVLRSDLLPDLERWDLNTLKYIDAICQVSENKRPLQYWTIMVLFSACCDEYFWRLIDNWMSQRNGRFERLYKAFVETMNFRECPGFFPYLACIWDDKYQFQEHEYRQVLQITPQFEFPRFVFDIHCNIAAFLLKAHSNGFEWKGTPLFSALSTRPYDCYTLPSLLTRLLDSQTSRSSAFRSVTLRLCQDLIIEQVKINPMFTLESVLSLNRVSIDDQSALTILILNELFDEYQCSLDTDLITHLTMLCDNISKESLEMYLKPILLKFDFPLTSANARHLLLLIFDHLSLHNPYDTLRRIRTVADSFQIVESHPKEEPKLLERFLNFLDRLDRLKNSLEPKPGQRTLAEVDSSKLAGFFVLDYGAIQPQSASLMLSILDRLQYLVTRKPSKRKHSANAKENWSTVIKAMISAHKQLRRLNEECSKVQSSLTRYKFW